MRLINSIAIVANTSFKQWFEDLILTTQVCIKDTGIGCDVVYTHDINSLFNSKYDAIVVYGPHNFTIPFRRHPQKIYVALDYEQTPLETHTCLEAEQKFQQLIKYYKQYNFLFTENESKNKYLKKHGIEAEIFDIGFHPIQTSLLLDKPCKKIYDVIMFGGMSYRRNELYTKLRSAGLKCYDPVKKIFNIQQRANLILKSKVCLNVHFYNMMYFEKPRIICQYFANKGFVISEALSDLEGLVDGQHLVITPYNKLVDTVRSFCDNERADERLCVGNEAFDFVRKHKRATDHTAHLLNIIRS